MAHKPNPFPDPPIPTPSNNMVTINFLLQYQPNQKVYISYRKQHTENYSRYDMTKFFNNYQKSLALDKNEFYEYYYSVEKDGQVEKENGSRRFHYDEENCSFEMDKWNYRWVIYRIEAHNQQLFKNTTIDIIGDGNKLKMEKFEPKQQNEEPTGRRPSIVTKKFYQSVRESVPLDKTDIIRQFSFVCDQITYNCREIHILENQSIKMNFIQVNFESKQLIIENLKSPLKDYIYQSIKVETFQPSPPQPFPPQPFPPQPNLQPQILELQKKCQKANDELLQVRQDLEKERTKTREIENQMKIQNSDKQELLEQQRKNKRNLENLEKDYQNQKTKFEKLRQEQEDMIKTNEELENQKNQKESELQSEKLKNQLQTDKYQKQEQDYQKKIKQIEEIITTNECELEKLKNDSQNYLKKFELINQEWTEDTKKNARTIQEQLNKFEQFKQSKETELKNFKEKAISEMDTLKTQLDTASNQIKQLQTVIDKQGISENQIQSLCQDIFSNLPENQKQDLNQTLILYQNKIEKLKQISKDQKEQLECQNEKLLEAAKEKKRICEDFEETAQCLQMKINQLKDGEEQNLAQSSLLKQVKIQLAQQTKELKILKENYEMVVKQLEEQIEINKKLEEKNAEQSIKFNELDRQTQDQLAKQEQDFLKSKMQIESENQAKYSILEQKQKALEYDLLQEQEKQRIERQQREEQQKIEKQQNEESIKTLSSQITEFKENQQKIQLEHELKVKQYLEKLVKQEALNKDQNSNIEQKEQEIKDLNDQIKNQEIEIDQNQELILKKESYLEEMQHKLKQYEEKLDQIAKDNEQSSVITEQQQIMDAEFQTLGNFFDQIKSIEDFQDDNQIDEFFVSLDQAIAMPQ